MGEIIVGIGVVVIVFFVLASLGTTIGNACDNEVARLQAEKPNKDAQVELGKRVVAAIEDALKRER